MGFCWYGMGRFASPAMSSGKPSADARICLGILALAAQRGSARLFPYHRSHWDRLIKQYGREAGIRPQACHFHSLKHSVAMLLWGATKDLGQIQNFLGHKAVSSTLCYLREVDASKAHVALAGVTF